MYTVVKTHVYSSNRFVAVFNVCIQILNISYIEIFVNTFCRIGKICNTYSRKGCQTTNNFLLEFFGKALKFFVCENLVSIFIMYVRVLFKMCFMPSFWL